MVVPFAGLQVARLVDVAMAGNLGPHPLARYPDAIVGGLSQRTPQGEQQRKQHEQQDPEGLHVAPDYHGADEEALFRMRNRRTETPCMRNCLTWRNGRKFLCSNIADRNSRRDSRASRGGKVKRRRKPRSVGPDPLTFR